MPRVRLRSVKGLKRRGDVPGLVEFARGTAVPGVATDFFGSGDPKATRLAAIDALGQIGTEDAIAALIALVDDASFAHRVHAAVALGPSNLSRSQSSKSASFLGEVAEAVDREKPAAQHAPAAGVRCYRCGRRLQAESMERGGMTMGGALPRLYPAVVCTSCKAIECTSCKGTPVDAPCSRCGAPVQPAYENVV
jgi:hypothetical protein